MEMAGRIADRRVPPFPAIGQPYNDDMTAATVVLEDEFKAAMMLS